MPSIRAHNVNSVRDVNKIKLNSLNVLPGDKILDLGCSGGVQAMMIARQGLEVHGVDSSKALIKRFRAELRQQGLTCYPTVGDAHRLPYASRGFDAIVSTEVLEHVSDPGQVVKEAYRALRPGGRACIAVPTEISERLFRRIHPHWVEDSEHINVFRISNLSAILGETGFRVNRIEKQNFEWTVFWVVHSLFRSRFDFTGTPIEHLWLSKLMARMWQLLDCLGIGPAIRWIGNSLLPKSVYVYAEKPGGG